MRMSSKGVLFVISGPSGSGKGTLLKELVKEGGKIRYSVSATTRAPREGEVEGKNYFFVSREEFEHKIATGEMLEYTTYCGNYYGTPRSFISKTLEEGFDVLVEVETEGALNLMQQEEALFIFIMPPSLEELERRLVGRNTEKPEVIRARLQTAVEEIRLADRYDYIVVNDVIDSALARLEAIVLSVKCKTVNMKHIVREILQEA